MRISELNELSLLQNECDEWKRQAGAMAEEAFVAEQKLSFARQQRDEWKAKAEANDRDAARYRYLKTLDDWLDFQGYIEAEKDRLDAYIDSEIAKANP